MTDVTVMEADQLGKVTKQALSTQLVMSEVLIMLGACSSISLTGSARKRKLSEAVAQLEGEVKVLGDMLAPVHGEDEEFPRPKGYY